MTEFKKVGLVGMGTTGTGIAEVFATAGLEVIALEVTEDRAAAGLAGLTTSLASRDATAEATHDATQDATGVLARVSTTTNVADLADVDLVVEAVSEDLATKLSALTAVTDLVAHDVPVVTTTSVLSVTEVAAALANPSRCAGLHFFTPPPAHRTIEVVRAMQSDDEVVRRLAALVDELDDKIAVIVEDRPGFLINAMLMPYLNDVIQEFDDDLATAEDIDVALQLGLGYKTGPLQMLDRIGLDVHLRATQAAFDATGDSRYNPPPLLRRMVASGHLGNKNGLGFRVNQDTDHKSNNEEKD